MNALKSLKNHLVFLQNVSTAFFCHYRQIISKSLLDYLLKPKMALSKKGSPFHIEFCKNSVLLGAEIKNSVVFTQLLWLYHARSYTALKVFLHIYKDILHISLLFFFVNCSFRWLWSDACDLILFAESIFQFNIKLIEWKFQNRIYFLQNLYLFHMAVVTNSQQPRIKRESIIIKEK